MELTRSDLQFAHSMLDLKVIPALRRLGLVELSFNLVSLSNSPFVELISQLDALFLGDSIPHRPVPAYLVPAFDRTRFACYNDQDATDDVYSYFLRAGAQHIKLRGLVERLEDLATKELSSLTSKIQAVTQLRLRSLCFENRPWHTNASRSLAREEEQVGAVEAFKEVCREKEILFYHENGRRFVFEPEISEIFTGIVEGIRKKDQKERDELAAKNANA